MHNLIIRPHLGLGDMLIINAIVRERATKYDTVNLLCKEHNTPSVAFMLHDLGNVFVKPVTGDDEADEVFKRTIKGNWEGLRLGQGGPGNFNSQIFDQEFYKQAGVPFDKRWQDFAVVRNGATEIKAADQPYVFMHEDQSRGYAIYRGNLDNVFSVTPGVTASIFDYYGMLLGADEIHCIDSCFSILVDSIAQEKLEARRFVLHRYARRPTEVPTYRLPWEVWQ